MNGKNQMLSELLSVLRKKPSNIPYHRYTIHKFQSGWWMVEVKNGEECPQTYSEFVKWACQLFSLNEEDSFLWLFSDKWGLVDPSSSGLCDRITVLMNHGLPDDWLKQLKGEVPTSY